KDSNNEKEIDTQEIDTQEIDTQEIDTQEVEDSTNTIGTSLESSVATHNEFVEDEVLAKDDDGFDTETTFSQNRVKVTIVEPSGLETILDNDTDSHNTIPEMVENIRSNDPSQLDSDILEIFLEEARDILQENDQNLSEWKKDYANLSALQEIQRGMHTLKGGASMSELTVLASITHHIETLLGHLVEGLINDKDNSYLLLRECSNIMANMVQKADANKTVYESPTYLEALDKFMQDQTGSPLEYTPLPPSPISDQTNTSSLSKLVDAENKHNTYTLRVKSDLIEKLSSLVGENSISRSRLERRNTEHGFQLKELSRTIMRVGEQLRRLENETEAQILFRHETETEGNEDFDPLELDRFSEIQQLSRLLSESMDDLQNLRSTLGQFVDENRHQLTKQAHIHRELRNGLLSVSLVRFDSIRPRFEKIVEQVARDMGKRVVVHLFGGEVEVERSILEDLIPGLEHTVRNSVAHSIEMPYERRLHGKPVQAQIKIGIRREGAEISFIIVDDGKGIDFVAIQNKAKRLGILDETRKNDTSYLLKLLFESGFSTAKETTHVSGRGIGLEVLKEAVKERQGVIEIETEENRGVATSIRLPFTMSVTDALSIQAGRYTYAVPIVSIEGITRIPKEIYESFSLGEETYYSYGQNRYRLESLVAFIDPFADKVLVSESASALLIRVDNYRLAFIVDHISNRQEIIIKSVNQTFTTLPGVIGATILDDGMPVPVLEITSLGRYFLRFQKSGQDILDLISITPDLKTKEQVRILMVDDSITMRKACSKLLSKYDVELMTAKDGLDAIDVIIDWTPDLVLLDIEMPRMDGFEFATHLRKDNDISDIPIIMITSRTGDKHRQRAKTLGIDGYLGKPYTEEKLINAIESVLAVQLEK
ncbi:MAG: hybrid sensor histidine kinase/response regulator, partial [Ostreibacterium sp.]